MKSWDSESWDIVTQGNRTVCYWDGGSASVEAGSCAIDFLEIDWKSIRRELEEDWCSPQEEMIVHNRLRDPNAAPYYRLARWAHNTVERLRELNPVYGENFRRWVRYEVWRVYLAAYCASEESLCGQELYDNTFKHPSVEAGEAYKRYIEKVKPVMVKQMAADYQIQFLNTYPEFPYGMVFSVDERVVRKYLKGKKEIDSGDVTWNMRKASKTAG